MNKCFMVQVKHYRYFAFSLIFPVLLASCSTKLVSPGDATEPIYKTERVIKQDTKSAVDVYDPWESFNRNVYAFNYHFDTFIFLPVVRGYRYIMPNPAEEMVTNFFLNLGEIKNFINSALQLKGKETATTAGRFFVNSTIGVLGLFDPATLMQLPRADEDFGQTLGYYGIGSGPYIVLPILGPSSLRDTTGIVVDALVYSDILNQVIEELELSSEDEDRLRYSLTALEGIDTRHRTAFRYYDTGSPFEYELIRLLYKTKRELDIEK